MRIPKFGRGDTIKLLPNTPYRRAEGSLYVIRNVYDYSDLNDTVKGNLDALMEIADGTPVYYCSDEINYNVFVPETYLKRGLFWKKEVPVVEAANGYDKLYLRVAILAEASRGHQHHGKRREGSDVEV